MKRIFSGVQPSGNLHIGNYLGAIKNWVKLQDEYNSIFCVVDLHAITVPQNPEELRKKTIEVAKIYLAAGIDPKKTAIFVQSHVPEHTELTWILNTITRISELENMTQFKGKVLGELKDKLENKTLRGSFILKKKLRGKVIERKKLTQEEYIEYLLSKTEVGLFDYPVLMASDILLYDTNLVPVGEDQLQHIEITRTLARRFNKKFGETFVVPEPYITKEGMRIMGLDDPTQKMSKSAASTYNYIGLLDSPEAVKDKIKKAVTDSGKEVIYRDDKPALKNLINIYSVLSRESFKDIERRYVGKGYAEFKEDLAHVVVDFLEPFQKKFYSISDGKVLAILKAGAEKVRPMASAKLAEVKKKIGLL